MDDEDVVVQHVSIAVEPESRPRRVAIALRNGDYVDDRVIPFSFLGSAVVLRPTTPESALWNPSYGWSLVASAVFQ